MPAEPLQGYELVAHVFVAADGSAADHRYLAGLWDRCVAAFGLDAAVDPHPAVLPAAAPLVDEREELLAVRAGTDPGVHQVVVRRVHDVLCLSLVLAPAEESGTAAGWTGLEARWQEVQEAPTAGVLGSVRILQARLTAPDTELDVAALAPVVAERSGTAAERWRDGVLRAEPPLGPFAVWEAVDSAVDQQERDGRPDRRIVVVAPAARDPQLSAWTWSRGDAPLTPFARYLLHAAKMRFELRVRATSRGRALGRAAEQAVRRLEPLAGGRRIDGTEADAAAADLARLRALEMRLLRVWVWLGKLRQTVQIAAVNLAAHARRDQSAGLFADDREVAAWLDGQLGRDLAYLAGPLELARATVVTVAPLVPDRPRPTAGDDALDGLLDDGELDLVRATRRALADPTGPVADLLPQAAVLRDGAAQELQHIVRMAAAFQNVVPFATALLELAGRVCRVDVVTASGRSSGTGFLVGPDLMLTNHHVLAGVIDGPVSPTGVRCVFDHHVRADSTVDHGVPVGLAERWLEAASPPSPVDEQDDPTHPPGADELDFALVRLAGSPGLATVTGGRTRGWIELLSPPPEVAVGTPLLIIQHPEGNPMKLAIDTDGVLEVNANATRVRYGVNALGGSSGSPCFTFDLRLAAVHHSGSRDRRMKRNEGIPVAAIAAHLRDGRHAAVLEG